MKLKCDNGKTQLASMGIEHRLEGCARVGGMQKCQQCNIEIIKNGKRDKQPAEFDNLGNVVQRQAYQWLAYSVQVFEEPFYGETWLFRKS